MSDYTGRHRPRGLRGLRIALSGPAADLYDFYAELEAGTRYTPRHSAERAS